MVRRESAKAIAGTSSSVSLTALMKDGLKAILHDRLYQSCNYYIARGWIDTVGLTNIGYLYNSYHALGGNGTGTELYNRAKALPIKNSYTEE